MVEVINGWLFFFLVTGSVILFAILFSRLGRRHGKNRWLFGFLGAGCFLGCVRVVIFLTTSLNIEPDGYAATYGMLAIAI
jgi:hypothetical protein